MRKIITILIAVFSTQFSFNLSAQCTGGNCTNGTGTFNWTDGSQYIGEFKDSDAHGKGTFTYPNGMRYIGEWKDSKKHGQFTLNFPDGSQYIGEFKDDEFNGQGILNFPDGTQSIVEWKEGEFVEVDTDFPGMLPDLSKYLEYTNPSNSLEGHALEIELERIEQLFQRKVITEDERNLMRKKALGI